MTAIELLIVVAAVGLLLLITVPGSSMLIERYRLSTASSELARGLSLARSEAVRRGSTVRMCPSTDGTTCLDGGDWSQGWLVYSDGNGDERVQGIELIEAFEEPGGEITIMGVGPVRESASFNLSGLVGDPEAENPGGGEFLICHRGSRVAARSVVIDREGWVNVLPGNAGGCGAYGG
jgi:type IV fimbrial biogenesis protein FimT